MRPHQLILLSAIATAPLSAQSVMRPDLVVTVTVVTHGRSAADATQLNAERVIALLGALRRQALPDSAILTSGHRVAREDEWDGESRAPRDTLLVTEYAARNTVRITLRDLSRLGALMDTALAIGATEVTAIEVALPPELEARRRAIARAVATARESAEALLAARQGTVGTLLEVGLLVRMLRCR